MSNSTTELSEWMDEDESCCDKDGKDMYEWHDSVPCESWDWKRNLKERRSTRALSRFVDAIVVNAHTHIQ